VQGLGAVDAALPGLGVPVEVELDAGTPLGHLICPELSGQRIYG